MGNVRTIYLDWNGGIACSDGGAHLARQYDHLSNLVVFRNAPELENYYLIVEMKEHEDDAAVREMAPIQLSGPYWLIPNVYTQLVQTIKFQVCCKTESGDYERHSARFALDIIESMNHDGADLDVDPSPMFDAYKDYVDQRVDNLIVAAGDVVIDPTLSVSGAAADAKATGDAISETNERLDNYEDIFTGDVGESVQNWLEAHPEATTTVEDGSLVEAKFSTALKLKTIKDYVTPEMYGAAGDGETDDTQALQDALNSGYPVIAKAEYLITVVTVKDTTLSISGEIKGQIVISNNATVSGGTISQYTDDPCIKFESTLSGGQGYLNSLLSDCKLRPQSSGVGILLYSNTNALFGYTIRNIDITSCDKSIYIYNNKWITKGDFDNVFCHSPNYAIFIDNMTGGNPSYVGDLTFRNVYAQFYNHKPINFFNCNTGACRVVMDNSFCYDGIEEYYYKLASTNTQIIMLGLLKNDPRSNQFTNLSNLQTFYFQTIGGGEPIQFKVINRRNLLLDYHGSAQFQAFSSAPAISKFFGLIGRMGANFGAAFTNRVFGLSWYDGILTMFRSTNGTVESGYSYEVTTPYSGGVYTTATLPTTVTNGATCWCSDIKMAVTYYSNKWYKPDGTELIIS